MPAVFIVAFVINPPEAVIFSFKPVPVALVVFTAVPVVYPVPWLLTVIAVGIPEVAKIISACNF